MHENDHRKKIDTYGDIDNKIPTQFQKLSEIFKIEFPANWTKTFIFPESA